MKRLLLLSAVLSPLLIGCSTTTHDRGDSAAKSLQSAAAEVQVERHQLTLTMTSLESLVHKPAMDLRPQLKQFSANLDRLEAAARRNDKAAETALERNARYLESWDRQLTNMNYEVVRESSEKRRTEVAQNFNAVNRRYTEARTVMEPLLSYLNDIRRALDSDLTLNGLQAIKPVVANAQENAQKVHAALGRLGDELANAGARMSPVVMQTASNPTNVAGH
jgi:DNA repair exonuclease SbcCD ATPase subunit